MARRGRSLRSTGLIHGEVVQVCRMGGELGVLVNDRKVARRARTESDIGEEWRRGRAVLVECEKALSEDRKRRLAVVEE